MEYQYPIDPHWSTDEIIDVVKFFEQVEMGYEKGIEREVFLSSYRRFKEIVPSKSEEKKICDEFEETSGYSTYRLVKKMKDAEVGKRIKMSQK
ncbi:UPF0223 family protein [Cytobacillus spongiae]|jgi:uncharacterized protein YktA (UPF0223 family)|uniref:UPF0223 family protein n=1 Tax=Cytobacillus spongiae TaxID=2901381 RepID=UPI001F47D94E|nr:UPF0223 family protein [Cytobacillus spongiae]UII57256.1 UPF0223 family protein [Cytobacillus spongiae]